MTLSTSVWGAQHPNAGQNIQQMVKVPQMKLTVVYIKTVAMEAIF